MGKRIAVMGAGALGGYVGGYFAHHGQDVTLIDFWPENVETIRSRGLELDGVTDEEKFTVKTAKTLHYKDLATLAGQKPFDIIFISVKSYDTERVTKAVAPYLAKEGYAVSLQNCMNEDTIAAVMGRERTVGVIASMISVELFEAGRIRRMAAKGGAKHTVFRVGEIDGRITGRMKELVELFSLIDSSKATANLLGERWTKLTQNGMRNGICAATGLTGGDCDRNDVIRHFSIQVGGEAIRVGRALGYQLEKMGPLMPDQIEAASRNDPQVLPEVEKIMLGRTAHNPRAGIQRPSMAQDMRKGRKTEIEFMNGLIAAKGKTVGIATPANEKLVEAVLSVEHGKVKPSAAVLGG